jgi:formylglycine-generating enzyme required for sulfatase activity
VNIKSFRAQLDGLDALLRAEGMPCGPDVWQSVFLLLDRLERQGRLPDDARQLAPLLGPLFCRHPEEQARFPVLFTQWWSEGPALASINRVTAPEQAAIAAVRARVQRTGWFWLAGTLVLISILIAVLFFKATEKPVIVPFVPPPPSSTSSSGQALKDSPSITVIDRVTPRLQPEPPAKSWENFLRGIELTLNWLPGCLALLYLAKKYHQRWILNSQAASGDDLFNHFRFERVLTPIFGGAEAERALRDLRAARFQPTRRLDVVATVEATARSGDYFQPVYRNLRSAPEHLLLVRSLHRNDQQAALAEELVERFRKLGLQVQTYRFRDDPHRLVRWSDKGGEYYELAQLVARHSAARLLVISETDILFHPYSGEARPWLQEFTPWQDRVWLHPRDAGPEHAALLARSNFLVFPLARDSLPELVARLTAPEASKFTPQPAQPLPLPDLLAAESDAWLGEKPPYGADLSELVRQLERFLGTYGLRLLRAVAVYPKPHWQLTLALDYLLFGHLNTADPPERREQRLARLSRLPWLTLGHLPDWLREHLLLGMELAERQRITGVWQRLFSQLTNKEGSGTLSLEIRTPSKRQIKFRLTDFRAMKKSAYLDDPIFANILLGGKLGLLDFRLSRALAKLLPNTGKWMDLRPALIALVVAGFSVWGLHWAWQDFGQQALDKYLQTWDDRENATWHVELNYQADTLTLANALQKTLQAAKFQATEQQGKSQSSSDHNTISYAAGGKEIAQQVAQSLAWLSYGAAVKLTESSLLPANSIKVQLNQTYQHTAGFNDDLRYSYQKSVPAAVPKLGILPIEPDMVVINPGKFLMGSSEKEPDRFGFEGPQHAVNIAYAFALGKTEVTFAEYDRFAEATGRTKPDDSKWGRDNRPVIHVSFADAQAYVRWLVQQTGKNYRLPTEAEWEYAARAGSQTAYWWGDNIGKNNADCSGCGSQWDGKQTAPVGSFKANPFGLYDTAGNVWEWTQDCWHENYNQAPGDGSAWLASDGGDCYRRVVRGGSWDFDPQGLRSAFRYRCNTDGACLNLGFRVARAL